MTERPKVAVLKTVEVKASVGSNPTASAITSYKLNSHGMWRSLVAHLFWEQGVAGSNPVIPTLVKLVNENTALSH